MKSQSSPQLSLVVLVKDEANDLHRLLTHHHDLYDEAIVVDTGSEDDSVRVATSLGAEVAHFRWCDDFSAARNAGLARAIGDWILVLDCDELIATEDFAALRRQCQSHQQAWSFQQWNYCDRARESSWFPLPEVNEYADERATGYIETITCRLFPRRPEVRYQGQVHEIPDMTLVRCGVPIKPSGVVIHHYGHLGDESSRQKKRSFYGRLLRDKLKVNPHDPRTRCEMAVQLLTEGNLPLAERLLKRTRHEFPNHVESRRVAFLLARVYQSGGKDTAALAEVASAVRQWPAHRDSWLQAALIHAELGQAAKGEAYAARGASLFPTDPVFRRLIADNDRQLVAASS